MLTLANGFGILLREIGSPIFNFKYNFEFWFLNFEFERPKGVNVAHTKAKGSTSLGRDSVAKRLGVKKFGGQVVRTGGIIIRQRGSKYRAGENTSYGKDYTVFALVDGIVKFSRKKVKKFNNQIEPVTFVNVETVKDKKAVKQPSRSAWT